jgi:hypothetical protein
MVSDPASLEIDVSEPGLRYLRDLMPHPPQDSEDEVILLPLLASAVQHFVPCAACGGTSPDVWHARGV